MPREITRTRASLDENAGGLDQFATTRRVVKEDNGEATVPVMSGWSADRRGGSSGDRPTKFAVPDNGDEILFAFLEERPFASFYQHWVKTEAGRRAYVCLVEDCPLCNHGDKPKPQDWFNIIAMPNSDLKITEPTLMVWYCTADPSNAIRDRAETKRTSPLNKDGLYFVASKHRGKNNFPSYTVDPIRSEELEEWGVAPLTADQINAFKETAFTSDIVRVQSRNELNEVVDNYFED